MRVIIIRKKWITYSVGLIFLLTALTVSLNTFIKSSLETSYIPSTSKTIIIDPGHGGIDPGAIGNGNILEKHINLAITHYLREYFEQSGSTVIMTRETDIGLYDDTGSIRNKKNQDLTRRKEIVNDSGGDIFITIHLNAFQQKQYYGAQVFYPRDNPTSKELADAIQTSLVEILDPNNKRKPQIKDGIYLIKGIKMPTVLIECGFLSNPQELSKLKNKDYQEKVAWAIYVGVQQYLSKSQ